MTILKCLPPCNQRNYMMQQPTTIESDYYSWQYARIELMVASFTFARFTESYVWQAEDIIGALGGVLGLWLGLDVKKSIKLLGSAIYLLYSFVVTCWRKDENNDDDNSDDDSIEIQNANHKGFRRHTIVIVPDD